MTTTLPLRYDAARAALAEAKTFDDILSIHDRAEMMEACARIAGDTTIEQDAAEIRLRAKRMFGEMAIELKAAGKMHRGGRPSETGAAQEPVSDLVKLVDLGISKKFSSQAQAAAKISELAFEALVESTRARIAGGRSGASPINAARSVAPTREEAIDGYDYFPTAPWATRALMQHVLPQVDVNVLKGVVWEPACGEGHITGVLGEYVPRSHIVASDIYDYSAEGRRPPEWTGCHDFLGGGALVVDPDWIITNPPFTGNEDRALAFAKRALARARTGVALFVRSQWLVEGGERYTALFRDQAPTLCAFFTERVPVHKGRWEPDGSTMTAYAWVVWIVGTEPRAPFWIPPYCRATLTKRDDIERFTAHPVKPFIPAHDPETGEIITSSEAA